MDVFSTKSKGRTFVLSLKQGELLLESITAFVKKQRIRDGVVVSGIGTLDRCVLHMVMTTGYPPVERFPKWSGKALELASVQGVIADGACHFHAVISDDKRTWAGHLETGCRVLYLAEIVILETPGFGFHRIPDEKGIKHLRLKTRPRKSVR
jgi:predicted DNA-binding protein with PD1-like motif